MKTYIPCSDAEAWDYYQDHNWVYDKLRVAQSQGMACAPTGIAPRKYPVIVKPITNLENGGKGARKIETRKALEANRLPGFFWMPFFRGKHFSIDCPVVDGECLDFFAFEGIPTTSGMFDRWDHQERLKTDIKNVVEYWVDAFLESYTGWINIELIGSNIIEVHLRQGDVTECGPSFAKAVEEFYATGRWIFDEPFPVKHIFVLWGDKSKGHRLPKGYAEKHYRSKVVQGEFAPGMFNDAGQRLAMFSVKDWKTGIEIREDIIKNTKPAIDPKYLAKIARR